LVQSKNAGLDAEKMLLNRRHSNLNVFDVALNIREPIINATEPL
jgi:hypothetical protein